MWAKIRVRTEGANFNAVVNNIKSFPARVDATYFPIFQEIAQEGAEMIRFAILDAETETGKKRAERGGNGPGRVDTGRMFDNVGVTTRQLKRGGYSMSVGWRTGQPGYAIFQEHGTKRGVEAMNALGQANAHMASRVAAIKGSKPPIIRDVSFNMANYGAGFVEDE